MKIVSSQACLAMMARCHRTSTSHFGHHPRWAINDGQRYAIASLINSNCTLFFSPELRQCDNWWHFCFSPAGISLFSFVIHRGVVVWLSFQLPVVSHNKRQDASYSSCSVQLIKTPLNVFIKSFLYQFSSHRRCSCGWYCIKTGIWENSSFKFYKITWKTFYTKLICTS